MLKTESIDYHSYLPPYRSLLNPNARYDYQTHSLIPLSQNDLSLLRVAFQEKKKPQPSAFKMKYKSLLSDVSRSISLRISSTNLLSTTNNNNNNNSNPPASSSSTASGSNSSIVLNRSGTTASNSCLNRVANQPLFPVELHIKNLPIEILDYIFYLVDDKLDYKSCMFTCKLFYFLSKPYYYENLHFVSTYRFAQFITYLRLNSDVGQYVKSIDLSGIKPGYDEDEEQHHHHQHQAHAHAHAQEAVVPPQPQAAAPPIPPHDDNEDVNPGVIHAEKADLFPNGKIYAGWRDWKFKNNPLYTVHAPPSSLTKVASNSQYSISSAKSSGSYKSSNSNSSSSKKFAKPFKYFKSRKRSRSYSGGGNGTNGSSMPTNRKSPKVEYLQLSNLPSNYSRSFTPHPLINKFLINYSTSKDIPIGYILHLINLCPNLVSLNLGNLSLSTDYELCRSSIHKYQNFDLMNNYSKDMIYKIDNIMRLNDLDDIYSFDGTGTGAGATASSFLRFGSNNNHLDNVSRFGASSLYKSNQSTTSTASSVYSVTTFSKPIRKYNSLLPPLPPTVADISYLNKGDGKVYLSDLNLKSINNAYLQKINEEQVLTSIIRIHGKRVLSYDPITYHVPVGINADIAGNLKYVNLSSMIWLNRNLIERFLTHLLMRRSSELDVYGIYDDDDFSRFGSDSDFEFDDDDEDEQQECPIVYKQDLVIDLTDSGMYKNLPWAKKIDLNTFEGCQLVKKIIQNELLSPQEEHMRRDRQRRGRIGENFLA